MPQRSIKEETPQRAFLQIKRDPEEFSVPRYLTALSTKRERERLGEKKFATTTKIATLLLPSDLALKVIPEFISCTG